MSANVKQTSGTDKAFISDLRRCARERANRS